MFLSRAPRAPLRPFVKTIWASLEAPVHAPGAPTREIVLPTGAMHLAIRLTDQPLRIYDGIDDHDGREVDLAVVGGVRAGFYVRDVSTPTRSVGAMLQPGAAQLLFGAPAQELAETHTPLGDVWGKDAALAREQLLEAGSPEHQLEVFEALLSARLPRVRGLHPAVAHALERFDKDGDVRRVVGETGYSHRAFIALFRRAVGLTPKLYCRVARFQRALEEVAAGRVRSWVEVALRAGYSDQPHFNREFREFAGLSPGAYRAISPPAVRHVPLGEVNSMQDRIVSRSQSGRSQRARRNDP